MGALGESAWNVDETGYENQLLSIVGNNTKLDIGRYQDSLGFGSGLSTDDVLPYRNLGNFIIMVKSGAYGDLKEQLSNSKYNIEIVNEYDQIGFSVKLSPEALKWILTLEEVDLVDEDLRVDSDNEISNECVIPWGIDHIDKGGMNCNFDSGMLNGKGSHIYIVDTGVSPIHNEFNGRLGKGVSYVDSVDSPDGELWGDCNGHGTHCAGTAAGKDYGIAKQATIHGVRVLSCSGSGYYSWIISGLNWVGKHVIDNNINKAVVSMSLGGGNSESLKRVVNNLVDKGIIVVVAAGNNNKDACNYSPANAEKAITVGSTVRTDIRSSFSNYGDCVDIFAPGSDIKSAWIGSSTEVTTISGTSMATPHVAGVVALLLQKNTNLSPSHIKSELINLGDKDRVKDSKTVSNYLSRVPFQDYPTSSPTPYPTPYPTPSSDKTPSLFEIIIMILLVVIFIMFISSIIYYCCFRTTENNTVSMNNIESELGRV